MSNQEFEMYPRRFWNASVANEAAGASTAVFPTPSRCRVRTKEPEALKSFPDVFGGFFWRGYANDSVRTLVL